MSETTASQALASFLTGLRYEDLPDEVVERTKEFFLDWAVSALAGRGRGRCVCSRPLPK